MSFGTRKHHVAPVSKDGGGPMVRDAAHEATKSGETEPSGSSP
jgi:hypothetical protein